MYTKHVLTPFSNMWQNGLKRSRNAMDAVETYYWVRTLSTGMDWKRIPERQACLKIHPVLPILK